MDPEQSARALIFDCDGTLVDSMPVHYQAWAKTMARHGIDFTEKRFYELAGWPADKIATQLSLENRLPLDAPAVAQEKDREFLQQIHRVRPNEPVIAIARRYRGVKPMAVGSGTIREIVEKELAALGILDWFGAIVCAEDVARHKPEPDVFLAAAQRLGVPPGDCVVYEDGDPGLEAARRAGMKCVDVRTML
jgi:beta-phosphoglucomutase-like phosphatase (HAD superfamily)